MTRFEHIQRTVSAVFLSANGPDDDFRVGLDFREGDSLLLSSSLLSVVRLTLGENLACWGGRTLSIAITAADLPDDDFEF